MKKILIAYDGSECAEQALNELPLAGLGSSAQAVVLAAADVYLPPVSDTVEDAAPPPAVVKARAAAQHALQQATAAAEAGADRVRQMFPGWTVSAEAHADNPAWAVIRKADAWSPDLVVCGAHGRSAIARLMLGSTSQKILSYAPCSVRVARRPAPGSVGPVRLIIGIDGSPGSAAALSAVASRKWPAGSEALALVVMDLRLSSTLTSLGRTGPLAGADEGAWAQRAAAAAAEELTRSGLTARSEVVEGDPKRLLVEKAGAWKTDCIFVGAKGMTAIERFLLGSVSASVAARANCSVEVVRFAGTT